jgi:SRSO17 transposase
MDETILATWAEALVAYHARFARFFRRAELRERSQRYLHGLLAPVERKNGWQLAEAVGEDDPQGIQRLLFEAVWDADAVGDEYQCFVVEQFGDPEAVLVLDETGFVKKGTKSVGVQRQYSGTAGKVENCQVGVFLAYVTRHGHVLLDRRLYLPEVWATDPVRRAEAKVPETVTFQTVPELGQAMLEQAWAQEVPHAWVTADERYGAVPSFLAALEERGTPYVIAVPATTRVWPAATKVVDGPGRLRILKAATAEPVPVAEVVARWEADAWQRLAVGAGAKGPRVYDWAAVRVVASRQGWPGPHLWLLVRRSLDPTPEYAYYLAQAPADTPLLTLAQVAASRWPVEQCFEEAKGEAGLDQYEVRSWPSWHRHITLAMLAHGFLAWQRREAGEKAARSGGAGHGEQSGAAECAGDPPVAGAHLAAATPDGRPRPALVALATPASGAGAPVALSPPTDDSRSCAHVRL